MQTFDYARPGTIAETIALLEHQADPRTIETRILAGGTDLLPLMKGQILSPSRVLDIKRLIDLDDVIELQSGTLRIGALATLAELHRSGVVRSVAPALAEAASVAASPQLRNMATIGGNVLQRPRCWYFRDHEVSCWLKGGDDCPAIDGENQPHAIFDESRCHAVHPSDPATALLALDATLGIRGASGDREEPIARFFAAPTDDRRVEHTLRPDEVIVSVSIPATSESARSTYIKAMDRKAWAFALVGVATRMIVEADRILDARIVLGGVAPIPHRCVSSEALLIGAEPSRELFDRVADDALASAQPLAHNAYKVPLANALIVRALEAVSSPGFPMR